MTDPQQTNALVPLSPLGEPLRVCSHCEVSQAFELRRRTIRNGATRPEWQCLGCGQSTGQPVSLRRVADWESRPEWDEALSRQYADTAEAERLHEAAEDRARKRVAYAAYLQSDVWRAKHLKVLRRDEMCRACGEAPSAQAHHLTYDRIFREPLFDLVGVCRPCHEELHRHDELEAAIDIAEPPDEDLDFG
jgi:hypothetical protein